MKVLKSLFLLVAVFRIFTVISPAQSPHTAERELSIQISGFQSMSDSFTFKDHNSRVFVFTANQTKIWGKFPVGSNYSLTQTSGPRPCRMTNNEGKVPNYDLLISINCTAVQSAVAEISVQIYGFQSLGDSFTFKDQNSREYVFTANQMKNLGRLPVGSNYSLTQVSGPRPCRTTNNQGVVPANGLTINVDCSPLSTPPTTTPTPATPRQSKAFIKFISVSWSDNFEFDLNGNKITINPQGIIFGNFEVGKNYNFSQTKGPRTCKLTNASGIVPAEPMFTITVDCTPVMNTELPPVSGKFGDFDLVSRSSDQKSFGTFYGSITPSIGGINETGVTEGQFVAYMTSWNVDPKHGGKYRQIMWFNRGNGKTAVVSRSLDGTGGDKDSYNPSIDNKGYAVAFESNATNLVSGDTNKVSDIFVWTLMDDTVRCITCSGNYGSTNPSISGDGNYVVFQSGANNLTAGVEGNSMVNVYLANLRTGEITLISKDPKTGKGVSGSNPSISEDGSRIAFYSYSDKLADGDKNGMWDIFVREHGNPKLKRVSLTAEGTERNQGAESISRVVTPTISGNGKYVAFSTMATNMSGSLTDKSQNVYLAEIDSGRIVRVSSNAEGIAANGDSPIEQGEKIAVSYDGKWVAFTSKAVNLGGKIIVKNIETGEIISFVKDGGVGTPTLSRNGKCVAFPTAEKLDKRFDSTGIFAACR